MLSLRDMERKRTERIRGWIIYFLYKEYPKPIDLQMLTEVLDSRNYPLTRRQLAKEIDYLRAHRLIRIFPLTAENEMDEVQQSKLIQRYMDSESDEEMKVIVCARITTAGINFHEGVDAMQGIHRVG